MVQPQTKKEFKTATGHGYIFSPLAALYNNMMRTIILDRWALDGIGKFKFVGVKNNLDSEATNRSSIVPMFERHDKYPSKNISCCHVPRPHSKHDKSTVLPLTLPLDLMYKLFNQLRH